MMIGGKAGIGVTVAVCVVLVVILILAIIGYYVNIRHRPSVKYEQVSDHQPDSLLLSHIKHAEEDIKRFSS